MATVSHDELLHKKTDQVCAMRAMIVEDEDLSRRLLHSLLAAIGGVEVIAEAVTASEAKQKISDLRPDLVLMDIEIPGGNGIELLRTLEDLPEVVFITAHPEYALPAMAVQPADYLIKPVSRERLFESVRRARRRVVQRRVADLALALAGAAEAIRIEPARVADSEIYPSQLTIRVRRRRFWLDVKDICWIQGASQYCRIHAKGDEFLLSRSLSSLECELDPKRFFRVHRSVIVNAAHVREIRSSGDGRYNIFLHGGSALPVGRSRRDVLRKLSEGISRQAAG